MGWLAYPTTSKEIFDFLKQYSEKIREARYVRSLLVITITTKRKLS